MIIQRTLAVIAMMVARVGRSLAEVELLYRIVNNVFLTNAVILCHYTAVFIV